MLNELEDDTPRRDPERFFEWVKFRSHLMRGVIESTMLDDEVLHFMRLGMHLERADNMARMLDVRFHEQDSPGLSPDRIGLDVETSSDFYRWSAILACVAALEIYRKVYRDVITPSRVAELLIFNGAMPSSLLASMRSVKHNLALIANDRAGETQRLAGRLLAELEYGRIEVILHGQGLHRFLTDFLARINDLGSRISQDFLALPGR